MVFITENSNHTNSSKNKSNDKSISKSKSSNIEDNNNNLIKENDSFPGKINNRNNSMGILNVEDEVTKLLFNLNKKNSSIVQNDGNITEKNFFFLENEEKTLDNRKANALKNCKTCNINMDIIEESRNKNKSLGNNNIIKDNINYSNKIELILGVESSDKSSENEEKEQEKEEEKEEKEGINKQLILKGQMSESIYQVEKTKKSKNIRKEEKPSILLNSNAFTESDKLKLRKYIRESFDINSSEGENSEVLLNKIGILDENEKNNLKKYIRESFEIDFFQEENNSSKRNSSSEINKILEKFDDENERKNIRKYIRESLDINPAILLNNNNDGKISSSDRNNKERNSNFKRFLGPNDVIKELVDSNEDKKKKKVLNLMK